MSNTKFIFLLVTTLVNVYYWRNRGINARRQEVDKARDAESPRTNEVQIEEELSCDSSNESGDKYIYSYFSSNFEAVRIPDIYSVDSNDFDQYRSKYLGFFRLGDEVSMIINFDGRDRQPCERYANVYQARGDRMVTDFTAAIHSCVAVARVVSAGLNKTSHHLLRFDTSSKFDEADDQTARHDNQKAAKQIILKSGNDDAGGAEPIVMRVPTGMFTKVSRKRNREKVNRKMMPLFTNFVAMDKYVDKKLRDRGLKMGDDVVLMVVNVGEVDLFMNFACSCRFHGISLHNTVVFVANEEIVNIVENTGALALHDVKGFAGVNPAASHDYLDFTFVDMMWYKAFSLWMVVKRGYNVLFQDVDIVWFRDPFPYLHNIVENEDYKQGDTYVDAVFTDDGQRGLRYSPFYANSGFYYVKASPRATYFAWSIMMGFPMIQRTGSHQNVFTMRLQETMDLGKLRTKLLTLHDFPNGFNYHHNKTYMVDFLVEKKYQPYNFHMCWTQRKDDKLNYLRKTLMWYLDDSVANIETLGNDPKGDRNARERNPLKDFHLEPHNLADAEEKWNKFSQRICRRSNESP